MKKIICVVMTLLFVCMFSLSAVCSDLSVDEMNEKYYDEYKAVDAATSADADISIAAASVILMEKATGKVIYALNEHEKLYPASVTKIMTMLLVCEAIDGGKIKLSDEVACSENAASKGGSQIWLEPNEVMTVDDLLKATCVYSANDACTLLGEYVSGSEQSFVSLMNSRGEELGMKDTHFDNCTGLDDTSDTHLTSAYDIALMSREVLKHDIIKKYTTIWMDSLRDGETELVNTNKLVRFYDGITGLKTGTTSKAGCCVSATAMRDGMELIAVVMGSDNSNDRFNTARNLLDYGFANYEIFCPEVPEDAVSSVRVKNGVSQYADSVIPEMSALLINKGMGDTISVKVEMSNIVIAPVAVGQTIGKITVIDKDGKSLGEYNITTEKNIAKMTFFSAFLSLLKSFSK